MRNGKGQFVKGFSHHYSEKHRKHMSESAKGRVHLLETRIKISEALKGKARSLETREKISKGRKGIIFTKEHIENLSKWQKGISKLSSRGEKNWNWKGGITPLNHKIRTSLEMKLWRKACMERDNFTDAKTGQIGGELVVHHINNFADFPELRTSLENGITLSKESHKLFHHIYGNKNNTRQQLEEFIALSK